VDTANRLTALLHMQDQVKIEHGDGHRLPYSDSSFDGAYAQHVTMNVADRHKFFSEAFRVLKPGAFSRSPNMVWAQKATRTIRSLGLKMAEAPT
jgi:ubiquinone/menaquinone biosynthesis C-methylase UbiE